MDVYYDSTITNKLIPCSIYSFRKKKDFVSSQTFYSIRNKDWYFLIDFSIILLETLCIHSLYEFK